MENKIKLTTNDLDVIIPSTVDNDLLYHTAVLSKIEEVLVKTYGPYAGYISQLASDNAYSYTKDGMLTLSSLSFHAFTDNTILGLVQLLAAQIKATSGDGATTATLFLSNLIKNAAEYIYNGEPEDVLKKRVATPKAMELLQKLIKNELETSKVTANSYQDLKDAAFIALNNDSMLMKPFVQLIDHLAEHNVAIDEDLKIETTWTAKDDFDITVNSGFDIPGVKPLLDPYSKGMNNVKFIMIRDYISILHYHFVLKPIIDIVIGTHNKQFSTMLDKLNISKIVFIVGNMDEDVAQELVNYAKDANGELKVEFMILSYNNTNMVEIRDDLSVFTNVKETTLVPYIEKRDKLDDNHNSTVDNANTTNLLKWKIEKLPDGTYNYMYGLELFLQEIFLPSIENGLYCNLEFTRHSMTVVPVEMSNGKQQFSELYHKRIEELEHLTESEDKDTQNSAKTRLSLLNTNVFYIKVPYRVSDQARIYTACKDATNAITSIAKNGYHMGGSVGLLNVIKSIIIKVENKIKTLNPEDGYKYDSTKITLDTALLILNFIENSLYNIIKLLVPTEYRVYDDYLNRAIEDNYIKVDEYKFGEIRVISPIETDEVMMNTILFQFSNLFSSLMIEYPEIGHVMHIQQTVTKIKDAIRKRTSPKEEVKKVEPKVEDVDFKSYLEKYKKKQENKYTAFKKNNEVKEDVKIEEEVIVTEDIKEEVKVEEPVIIETAQEVKVEEIKEEEPIDTKISEEEYRAKMVEMGFDPETVVYTPTNGRSGYEDHVTSVKYDSNIGKNTYNLETYVTQDGQSYSSTEKVTRLDSEVKKYTMDGTSIEMSELDAVVRKLI